MSDKNNAGQVRTRSNIAVCARLAGLVKPLSGYMCIAIIMGFIGHMMAAFITVLGGYALLNVLGVTCSVSPGLKNGALFALVIAFAFVRGFLRYAEQACNHYIAFKLLALIRDKVFGALRRLCPAKLETRDRGNLISVITSDIELLEVFYAHTISPVLIALLFTIAMTGFIGSINPVLGVTALAAYIVVGVAIPFIISKRSGDYGVKVREQAGELSTYVLDSLYGLSEIIQFSAGEDRLGQLNTMTDELSGYEKKLKYTSGTNTAITNAVIVTADIVMLVVTSSLYGAGTIGFGDVVIALLALMGSFGPVTALAGLGSTLQNTFAAGNRVLDILDEEPLVADVTGKQADDMREPDVSVNNVTFTYPDEDKPIIDGLDIHVEANRVYGIAGRSGCGKSTLLKLIMRFFETDKGSITIKGTDVNDINTARLRDMQSYVTQDTHLFHDTIAANLRIAKLDATDDEIAQACRKASIHDFIMSLPKGYETNVGELGDTLSGGERQRIGLARAFLHDAPIMLLDEPTSNLDSLNEAVILKALKNECGSRTVIMVSHRKSTMGFADYIYEMRSV